MKKLQILGPGCAKCIKLTQNTEQAARKLGIEFELEKVADIKEIMKFGVMMTPALVVDGKVKLVGKVLPPAELENLIKD
ncbi:MAG TPA: thioredoxin family protein [Deltaproteobacteria bacterium]|nr:thioredoxin family protein [Deltaproteobacteria bacterium]HQI80871.1 thioredoxin family protein [Deltaproteobacteria bacterium]